MTTVTVDGSFIACILSDLHYTTQQSPVWLLFPKLVLEHGGNVLCSLVNSGPQKYVNSNTVYVLYNVMKLLLLLGTQIETNIQI